MPRSPLALMCAVLVATSASFIALAAAQDGGPRFIPFSGVEGIGGGSEPSEPDVPVLSFETFENEIEEEQTYAAAQAVFAIPVACTLNPVCRATAIRLAQQMGRTIVAYEFGTLSAEQIEGAFGDNARQGGGKRVVSDKSGGREQAEKDFEDVGEGPVVQDERGNLVARGNNVILRPGTAVDPRPRLEIPAGVRPETDYPEGVHYND